MLILMGISALAAASAEETMEGGQAGALTWIDLAEQCFDDGLYDQSLQILEGGMDDSRPDAWLLKGRILMRLGRMEDALEAFNRTLDLDNTLAEAWNGKGVLLAQRGQIAASLDCFENATYLNPKFKDAWNNMGLALYYLDRPGDAIICLERALALDQDDANTWTNMGLAQFSLGRGEDAIQSFDQALLLDPGHEKAKEYRQRALELVAKTARDA